MRWFPVLVVTTGCGSLAYYGDRAQPVDDPATDAPTGPGRPPTPPTSPPVDTSTPPITDTSTPPITDTSTPPITDTAGTDTGTPPVVDTAGTDTGTPPVVDTAGTDTGTPPPPVPIILDSVTPHYGPDTGGTEVVLTGSFDAATVAYFDGIPATIVSQTPTELTVTTPPHVGIDWIDVAVESDKLRTDLLPASFQYWPDETGNAGLIGSLNVLHEVGGYWPYGAQDLAYGDLAFTTNTRWSLLEVYAPALDQCVFQHVGPTPTPINIGAPSVQLSSGATTFGLSDASIDLGPGWYRDFLSTTDVVPGTTYDIDPILGILDWPDFGVVGSARIDTLFDVTDPPLDSPTIPLTGGQIELAWTGSGGDYMLVYILRTYRTGGDWLRDGWVTCAVADTGAFTIPDTTWPDWYEDDRLHVQVGRVFTDPNVLPHNNADSEFAGIVWTYGLVETILGL